MMNLSQSPAPLRWILRVMGKWKRFVVLLLLIQTALALCGVATAWIFREIVNQAASRSMNGFTRASAVLILLQAVLIALRAAWRFLREYTESGVENQLKDRLFSTLLTRDFSAVTAVRFLMYSFKLSVMRSKLSLSSWTSSLVLISEW